MTTALALPGTRAVLDDDLAAIISERAAEVDLGQQPARYVLPLLADRGFFASDHDLVDVAHLVRDIASLDLSVAFSTWAHLMALTYLRQGHTQYLADLEQRLTQGTQPGVTGMASAFKQAAGCGTVDLSARNAGPGEGIIVDGRLAWASNLYDDAIIITAAGLDDGTTAVFALPAATPGVELGQPYALLGMNSTASTGVVFEGVHIPEEAIITRDFRSFVAAVKPTFVVLQTSECLGVAAAAAAAARTRLAGVNASFTEELDEVDARIDDISARHEAIALAGVASPRQLLTLRLDAAQVATAATAIEVRVAGGAGYARTSPASRRFREATFLPVQSPSGAQLRWELNKLESEDV